MMQLRFRLFGSGRGGVHCAVQRALAVVRIEGAWRWQWWFWF